MKLTDPLVSVDWLASHLDRPQLRIFDTTVHMQHKPGGGYLTESGYEDWRKAHIPGAGFLDLAGEFSDPDSEIPFTMPSPERFCQLAAEHGVSDDSAVVLYSHGPVMWATRAWWMFRSVGFDNVAVLDGGWQAWSGGNRPVSSGLDAYPCGQLHPKPQPHLWADREEMQANQQGKGVCTLNALAPTVYSGEDNRYGRPGHIPGSYNVFNGDLLDPESGRFLERDAIREKFKASGALTAERVVVYCGGGISATVDALALLLLGHGNVAVYDGSMSEWVRDEDLPLTLGSEP